MQNCKRRLRLGSARVSYRKATNSSFSQSHKSSHRSEMNACFQCINHGRIYYHRCNLLITHTQSSIRFVTFVCSFLKKSDIIKSRRPIIFTRTLKKYCKYHVYRYFIYQNYCWKRISNASLLACKWDSRAFDHTK